MDATARSKGHAKDLARAVASRLGSMLRVLSVGDGMAMVVVLQRCRAMAGPVWSGMSGS